MRNKKICALFLMSFACWCIYKIVKKREDNRLESSMFTFTVMDTGSHEDLVVLPTSSRRLDRHNKAMAFVEVRASADSQTPSPKISPPLPPAATAREAVAQTADTMTSTNKGVPSVPFIAHAIFNDSYALSTHENKTDNNTNKTDNNTNKTDNNTNKTDNNTNKTDNSTNETDNSTNKTDNNTNKTDNNTNKTDDNTNKTDDNTNKTDNNINKTDNNTNKTDNNTNKTDNNTNSNATRLSDTVFGHYLKLINTLHEEARSGSVPDKIKNQTENLLRFGHGLRPHLTDRGDAAWNENGLVYKRRNVSENSTDPFPMEYEAYVPFDEGAFFEGRQLPSNYKAEKKVILWHTKARYIADESSLSPIGFCPDFPCYVTTNKKYEQQSSAMIFAAQIMPRAPPQRKQDQVFILHNHEPPYTNKFFDRSWVNGFNRSVWKPVFNWTMTYRMDSDFVVPYGVVRKRIAPLVDKDYRGIVSRKKKVVAWMVSNCVTSSEREKYVSELRKYIKVDVIGKCGSRKCPYDKEQECSDDIAAEYKFYLSFESAICADYITEKFFRYLTMDLVVVARGSNEYFRHAPREIFLNTADFHSPKYLAQRLLYLHTHEEAYIDVLKNKDKYVTYMEGFPIWSPTGAVKFITFRLESHALCHVCQRLWNLDKYAKSVSDIHQWFNKKICRKAKDF